MYRAIHPDRLATYQSRINATPAQGRIGTPNDIADIVTFLCSEESRWITGSCVCANGGFLTN